MESDNNFFIQKDKQVETMASPVDFGLGEERWQHPELGVFWKNWLKENEGNKFGDDKFDIKEFVSSRYNRDIIASLMLKNPDIDFEDGLLNEDEDLEFKIMEYNDLKKSSDITPELKRNYIAGVLSRNRFNKDLTDKAYGTAFGLADNAYGKKEEDPYVYKPQFQQTTPSRASMLNTGVQKIDTSIPMFLQVANPFIPWNKFHPLNTQIATSNIPQQGEIEQQGQGYTIFGQPKDRTLEIEKQNQVANYINTIDGLSSANGDVKTAKYIREQREKKQAEAIKAYRSGIWGDIDQFSKYK